MPAGWEEIAARKPKFVVFGEDHGTQEAPAFIGNLACALANRGKIILVAIEHPSNENPAFQHAWHLPNKLFPAALERAGWMGRDDGVASKAMFGMVVELHDLAQQGKPINIVAFSGVKDDAQQKRLSYLPGQGPHDAAMAENIRTAADRKHYDYVLVLTGNVHARKTPIKFLGTSFEPMAMRLETSADIVTLDMRTAGGTAWGCQAKPSYRPQNGHPIDASGIVCEAYPLRPDVGIEPTIKPFVALSNLPGRPAVPDYDGIFWIGKAHSSPPAFVPQ